MSTELEGQLRESVGIDLNEYLALVYIESTPEHRMNVGDLSEALALPRSTMTYVGNSLHRKTLALKTTQRDDRRRHDYVLTSTGERVLVNARGLTARLFPLVAINSIDPKVEEALHWLHNLSRKSRNELNVYPD